MIQLLNDVFAFFSTHEAALAIMSAWGTREWQHMSAAIASAYPWLKTEGGLKTVVRNIISGEQKEKQQ